MIYLTRLLALFLPTVLLGQAERFNPRNPPPIWRTPLGLPGDWHKPLLEQDGAWAGDFGPGPYAKPLTRIVFGADGVPVASIQQTLPNPRVPYVVTEKSLHTGSIKEHAFSRMPRKQWQTDPASAEDRILRKNGLNRSPDYASPKNADQSFRTAAYGTNRPVQYAIMLEETGPFQVFLGFADPYRSPQSKVKRLMTLDVEGAETKRVSVVHDAGQNTAKVYRFIANDTNQDGRIEIEVGADLETSDPNVFISAIWIFTAVQPIDEAALIRGDLNHQALRHVDCGHEPQWQKRDMREDIIVAQFNDLQSRPTLEIQTRRQLEYNSESNALHWRGSPFVVVDPQPDTINQTENGWVLLFPKETKKAMARIFDGGQITPDRSLPTIAKELADLNDYWLHEAGLPWDQIGVGNKPLQELFDGSIRVMYQLLEVVDGKLQSQPGPSVYRGLWVSNQPRVGRALTHLGDLQTARSSFERTWEFQDETGRVVVLTPPSLLKETGTAVEAVYRHARLTGDKAYLQSFWPKFQRAAQWVIEARESVDDPNALNYRLMPSGLSDGGVGGVVPEYTSVYWGLHLLNIMTEAASWLGNYELSLSYQAELADYESTFRRAAIRDFKRDQNGNPFLPIKMEFDPEVDVPVSAQTVFSYLYYPARLFPKRDPLAEGNFAMLMDAPRTEGLLLSTGWLKDGVQPFIENTRASARLYRGEVDEANAVLKAICNHASPTHVWVEEQLPGTGPRKTTGDVPHSSASAEFINLVRYMMALEEGETLHIMKGITADWIQPGERIFLNEIPTEFGSLSMTLDVSSSGNTAHIEVSPVSGNEAQDGGVLLHLRGLKEAGFTLPSGIQLPDAVGLEWNRPFSWTLQRN